MSLREYITFNLPRTVVSDMIDWLAAFGPTAGAPAKMLRELRPALNRDRHRENIARIENVLGPLGDGDVLEAIADALEAGAEVER